MATVLFFSSLILFVCMILAKFSNKLGIPALLAFLLLGLVASSFGMTVRYPVLSSLAEPLCSCFLVFIMFYGGFGTRWIQAKKVAVKSVLLSSVGVILTTLLVGLFCYFVFGLSFYQSCLIGAVISSTDAATVFSILRSQHLNVRYHTDSLLEVESGSNDPFSYLLMIVFITLIKEPVSVSSLLSIIFTQLFVALAVGFGLAYISILILKRVHLNETIQTVFIFATAILSYSLCILLGGNGYLSVYLTGIVLGNAAISDKKALVHFFDAFTQILHVALFFMLGLMSTPQKLVLAAPMAFLIFMFLTFVARPLVVFTLLAPFRAPVNQSMLVSWAGLRGAASIVFSMDAVKLLGGGETGLIDLVFFIVLLSILIQGTLLGEVTKQIQMVDPEGDVMRSFSDYAEEDGVQFFSQRIRKKHPWKGKKLNEITLLPDTIIAFIIRDRYEMIPDGKTEIQAGDQIIFQARGIQEEFRTALTQITIGETHEWAGKRLRDIDLGKGRLILSIRRDDSLIIPTGKTTIRENDVLTVSG